MREMVLHHASVRAPDRGTSVRWLQDVSTGMAELVHNKVAQSSLRMPRPLQEVDCLPGYSLFDAYQDIRRDGERDTYAFLMRLSVKVPLLSEVGVDVKDRFLACEAKHLPSEDGEPLVFCAITDGIAVGFPSEPAWDGDRLSVGFNELLPDGSLEACSETIDNLTRSVHARPICARHRVSVLQDQSPAVLWERRADVFPRLTFGPDVEFPQACFWSVVRRLAELDESVVEWRTVGGAAPRWKCKVTPESDKLMNNKRLREARRFRSRRGTHELFEWHARVGSGMRIHLRFDADTKEVEIGYVGPHLPRLPR